MVTAIYRGQDALAKVLLERTEVDINMEGAAGNTALMFAALWGKSDIAHHLLVSGANYSKVNAKGETALALAMNSGNKSIARMLRSFGATK